MNKPFALLSLLISLNGFAETDVVDIASVLNSTSTTGTDSGASVTQVVAPTTAAQPTPNDILGACLKQYDVGICGQAYFNTYLGPGAPIGNPGGYGMVPAIAAGGPQGGGSGYDPFWECVKVYGPDSVCAIAFGQKKEEPKQDNMMLMMMMMSMMKQDDPGPKLPVLPPPPPPPPPEPANDDSSS